MKEAYLRRDLEGVRKVAHEGTPPSERAAADKLERGMIGARNHRMVERMTRYFDGGAFVAIGALHLPGDDGVLALLQQRGYAIKRIY
jgi:uncharacterized protein YbaP (TraB family)